VGIFPNIDVPNQYETADFISENGNFTAMTIAELVGKLAGLPPMMEIFVNADGTSMFVNDLEIERLSNEAPPYARLHCSVKAIQKAPPALSKEELESMQKQNAMQLAHNLQEAEKMPGVVE